MHFDDWHLVSQLCVVLAYFSKGLQLFILKSNKRKEISRKLTINSPTLSATPPPPTQKPQQQQQERQKQQTRTNLGAFPDIITRGN